MDVIERFVALFALAFLRYLPPIVLPAMTPLRWAPPLVRIVLALGLAWLTVIAAPLENQATSIQGAGQWIVAAMSELAIGFVFGLVVLIPQGALHMAGSLLDIQAGLGAATLFNPGADGDMQSLLGGTLMLLTTVLFFTLDLHQDLYQALVASTQVLPIGNAAAHLEASAFFAMLGSSFLLALMIVAPVMLGLFAVDVGVAYATRSMPQANVYFLMLPLKIMVALMLLVTTLPLVPALIEHLFRDAFARVPALLGA